MIVPKLGQVVDYVVQKIWNENRELVRTIVYEAYQPETYNRTGEFKEAWATEFNYNTLAGKAQGQFYYNPDDMTLGSTDISSPNYGQHVSAITGESIVDALAEIIYQGKSGPAFGSGPSTGAWARKRDVWDALIKRIGQRQMKKWLKEGFDMVGLPVHSYGASLGVTFR